MAKKQGNGKSKNAVKVAPKQQTVKKKKQGFDIEDYLFIPMLLAMLVVPLIVRMYYFDPNLSGFKWFPSSQNYGYDFFLRNRGIWLIVTSVLMVAALIAHVKQLIPLYKKNIFVYFLMGFMLLVTISSIASPNRYYSFHGFYEQFESLWVVLCYAVVMIYAFSYFMLYKRENDVNLLMWVVFILMTILAFIGITQLAGCDFYNSGLGKSIIVPEQYAEVRDGLNFEYEGGVNSVYMTLYNPNYVGVFASMMMPVAIAFTFIAKKIWQKIIWVIVDIAFLLGTFGSGSKTFAFSFIISGIVAVVILRKNILRHWKASLIGIIVLVAAIVGVFSFRHVNPFDYVKNALNNGQENLPGTITEVKNDETGVYLTFEDGSLLHMTCVLVGDETAQCTFDDGTNELSYTMDEEYNYILDDERYSSVKMAVQMASEGGNVQLLVNYRDTYLTFENVNGTYVYKNRYGNADEIVNAPADAIFSKHLSFATMRGYIWSRTIPLLKKYIILGSGADTFGIVFPQNDYLWSINGGHARELITKPHNMYLQWAVQYGMIAMLLVLAVFVLYIISAAKALKGADFSDKNVVLCLGIFLGTIGYLVSCISNDSSVATTPYLFLMIGIGFAFNRRVAEMKENADSAVS